MAAIDLNDIDIPNLAERIAQLGAHLPVKNGQPQLLSGTGAPTISAPSGSLYLRQNAGSSTLYVNQSVSSPGTTWTAVTIP
jgi:hypothetical protein